VIGIAEIPPVGKRGGESEASVEQKIKITSKAQLREAISKESLLVQEFGQVLDYQLTLHIGAKWVTCAPSNELSDACREAARVLFVEIVSAMSPFDELPEDDA
jgi:hypothetical protein